MRLPLGLLPGEELVQDGNILLQRSQPLLQLGLNLGLVVSKLLVKVGAVWGSAHSGAENGLDDERVVGLEGVAVGIAEGVGELLG